MRALVCVPRLSNEVIDFNEDVDLSLYVMFSK